MISLSLISEAWNNFFFLSEPASTIGLVRMCLGFVLLIDSILIWKVYRRYFSEYGVFKNKTWEQTGNGHGKFSIYHYLSDEYSYLILSLLTISTFGFMIGLYTKLCALIVYILLVSLHHRNSWVFNSGDSLLRTIMFLMIFSRADQGLSVDCYLNGWDQLYTYGQPWCERLMMLQVCVVYAYTSWSKMGSNHWINGDAVYYPLNLDSYKNGYVPKFLLRPPFVQIASWSTLIIQQLVVWGVWIKELRYISMSLGLLLHMIFAYCLRLEAFSFIMMCLLLLFIVPEDLSRWLSLWLQ